MVIPRFRLLSVLLATLFPAIPLFGQAASDPMGINIHFHDAKPGEMEMLAAGGFKFVRIDMLWNQKWSATEKEKGVYDFSAYDHQFDDLKARQMHAICIFAYGNPLYDGGLSPHTDEGRQAFANWPSPPRSTSRGGASTGKSGTSRTAGSSGSPRRTRTITPSCC